jgi:hypothetical protein
MKDQKWSDERIIESLEKSGRLTMSLSRKSRKKVMQALMDENARLSDQKKAQKSQQGLSRILASLSNH